MRKEAENRFKALCKKVPGEDQIKITNILNNMERTFLPLGSRIGKYQIIEEIDRGGMAVVYKVCQLDLNRIVALKVLPANVTINRSFVERFLAEAHSVAKLHHPNIVTIHEISMENNIYYLAMDYIPGKNLFYYLNQEKPKLVEVLEITRQLAGALAYAHEMKILHRDLKLNNVIMRGNIPVLIDFGLAKALEGKDADLTESGEIAGSPAYMAPERIFGRGLDARSDICSLGIMLYEMLTFKNPYLDPRSVVQTTKNVIEANPMPPRSLVPWLPVEVESIALKAMSGEPEDRYQSMEEFAADIVRYQKGDPVLARPPSLLLKAKHFLKKHWAPVTISAICILFSALIMALVNFQSNKEKSYWQLAHHESFSTKKALVEWTADNGDKNKLGNWHIADSALHIQSTGYSYLKLNRPIMHDIRVEFELSSANKKLYNAGLFLFASVPDSGYKFHVHKLYTNNQMRNGISYPGSQYIHYNYQPIKFPINTHYHVVIEKKDQSITYWINNVLIARIYDFFPRLGENYQQLGFFVQGCSLVFDNLKIYRRSVPRLVRPTIIADRFWEQGDLNTALQEFKNVLLDLPQSNITRQVQFKLVDCFLRLHDFSEAKKLLVELEKEKKISTSEKARVLYLYSMFYRLQKQYHEMNSSFYSLAELYPETDFNKSAALTQIVDCHNLYRNGSLDSALYKIIFLAKKYPPFSSHFSRIHLKILSHYVELGLWQEVPRIAGRITSLHKKDEEVVLAAKLLLAKTYLGKWEMHRAVEVLNQCLASPAKTETKWQAWMTIAEVYEYSNNYNDALRIYKKIFFECPKALSLWLMARIRIGEILAHSAQSKEKAEAVFIDVIGKSQRHAKPHLIALYYTNLMKPHEFKKQWQHMYPENHFFLYYFSRKALFNQDHRRARKYLNQLKNRMVPHTWDYVRITNEIENYKTQILLD